MFPYINDTLLFQHQIDYAIFTRYGTPSRTSCYWHSHHEHVQRISQTLLLEAQLSCACREMSPSIEEQVYTFGVGTSR
jgi:hypothetical protein